VPFAGAVGHIVSLGVLAGGVLAAIECANSRAEFGSAGVEAAYSAPPDMQPVSGGPASGIEWSTLSREGVRFVNMALTLQEIAETTGVPLDQTAPPVRAFAGLDSAPSVDARVDLVMADLERLGAFERSVICVVSPTGSGYVNYVAVETLEYLTRGDCATVGLQYSLRPSFLSIDRVPIGREQNRALLHALKWRLQAIPEDQRPRLVGFGESLGAETLQDAFLFEGASGFHRAGIDRALFLGTPAISKWARQWRLAPERSDPGGQVVEVASYDQWITADGKDRAQVRDEIAAPTTFRLFNGEWDKVHVVETALAQHAAMEQHSVAELAGAQGRDPLDLMLDLALAEDLQTVFTAQLLNSDDEAVGRMLNHPHSIVSLSDAGAHLTFFNDAGFGLHLLGHWARDLRAMSLADAVRRLTSQPASVFGIRDRSLIREGLAADLLLFDPATVGRGPKRRVFDLPGGAARLTTDALGVHGVWVNGQQVADSQGLLAHPPLAGSLLTEFAS